jgi:nicotinamide riboside kinase
MRRVGLIGAECTGKSSVAAALAAEVGAIHVPEALRAFVETRGRVPALEDQAGILNEQRASVEMAHLDHPESVIVCDPLPLMTAIYSVAYFDDSSLLGEAVDDARTYDLIWWCRPDIPWTPDGDQRDGEERRSQVDSLIGQIVTDTGLDVVELQGIIDTRIREAINSLQGRVTPE